MEAVNTIQLVPKPITVTTRLSARMIQSVRIGGLHRLAQVAALTHAEKVEGACLSMLKAGVPYTELEILQRGQDISFDGDIAVTIVRSRQ